MTRILLFLAGLFFLVGLFLKPPISSGPSGPALFSYTVGDPQPILRSIDMSPFLGLVVIVIFVLVLFRRK